MHFSICNETFGTDMNEGGADGWNWFRVCEAIAGSGYDGVEIAPFTFAPNVTEISTERRQEIRRVAEEAGLGIVGLHWLFVTPPGLHIHSADTNLRLRSVDYLRHLIDFAGDIGAGVMIFGSPQQRRLENGDYEGARQRIKESYLGVLKTLEERDVILCQESLPPPECDFLTTAAEAAQLVDEIQHPNFQLMLDVKSLCGEGRDPVEAIRKYGRDIHHLHANDSNKRGPGFGDVDFRPIARALRECDYTHSISVEVFDYSPDPETIARESLRYLKEVFEV